MSEKVVFKKTTHQQFFSLCQEVMRNAQVYKAEQPTYVKMCDDLTIALGFKVGPTTLAEAREATGVSWEPKPHGMGGWTKGVRESDCQS